MKRRFCLPPYFLATVALALLLAGCVAPATPPATGPKALARIALLADPHVNEESHGNDAAFKAHFETAIRQVNAAKVDLVLIAGDLTQSGKPEEFADFRAHIKNLQSPVLYVPGNHDVGNKVAPGINGATTPLRTERYEKELGPSWFSKSYAGVRVIGISSPVLGSGFACEEQQWKFLENELARPVQGPTLLLTHYPLFVKDPDEPGGIYWNIEPAPRHRLLALLKQGGVKTVLSGHLHRPLEHHHEGIFFLTALPVSFGLPAGKQPEGWVLLTVFENGDVKEAVQTLRPQ